MNELAEILYCTHRNVKIILTKLVEANLIEFTPGKGRGNYSNIVFLRELEEELLKQTQGLIKDSEINRALELVKEFGEGTDVKKYIMDWVNSYFGYTKQNIEEEDIEILRFPIFRPITTVDPTKVYFDLDAHIVKQVYNTLITYDHKSRGFLGCLAHDWDCNEERTKWVFYLRKGVKFHSGRPFTADDVKQSFLRLVSSQHGWLVQDILDIEIINKYTILFQLKKANHLFLNYLSFTPMSIIDTTTGNQSGTGPFKIVEMSQDVCILEAFDGYFQSRAHLDRIEIIRLSEAVQSWSSEFKSLIVETGESDTNMNTGMHDNEEVFSGTTVLALNIRKEGLIRNIEFRKVFEKIIDRDNLIDQLGGERIAPANGFLNRNDCVQPSLSVSEAASLLEGINYQGEAIRLLTYQRHLPDAKWIQERFRLYGINLLIEIDDWDVIQKKETIEQADMILFEATLNEGEISQLELYLYEQGFIRSFMTDDIKDKVSGKADGILAEPNKDRREEMFREVEELLKSESALIFLVHKNLKVMHDPSLRGVKINSRMWVDFKDVWFVPEGVQSL